MTPRSRKPVMLIGGGGEQQRLSSNCPTNSFCSFREQDEDEHFDTFDSADADGVNDAGYADAGGLTIGQPPSATLFKSKSEVDFSMLMLMSEPAVGTDDCEAVTAVNAVEPESLTSPFK